MAEITVLKSRGIPLCKRFEREIKHPYPSKVKQFFADVRQATNIHELSKLLCQLEQNEPTACVIRGGLADGFLPLNKTHLAERCSSVGSEATAKVRIADLKRLKVLIEYLIRDANLYSVKYKASGSNAKKPSEAWVFDEALLQMKEVKVGKYTLVLITSDSN